MTISLTLIVEIAVAITATAGAVGVFSKKVNKAPLTPIRQNQEDISSLKSWTAKQQEDIVANRECDKMLLMSVRACLDGLHQQGCNGQVTKTAADLDEYILSRFGDMKSKSTY